MKFSILVAIFVIFATINSQAQALQETVTDEVSFDVSIGGDYIGTIKVGLFGKKQPRTVENFLAIAGPGVGSKPYKYEGSTFHRIIKDFMIQGGDVVRGDGTGSVSKFGGKFNDEFPSHKHSVKGLLSMANSGPNTNGSQFFITTVLTPWLDGKHVVFGKVVEGMDIVHKIEKTDVDFNGKPAKKVTITKSVVENLDSSKYYPVDLS